MNKLEGANLKKPKSSASENLEKFFMSNHAIAINRNKDLLKELDYLKNDMNSNDINSSATKSLKKAKVRFFILFVLIC